MLRLYSRVLGQGNSRSACLTPLPLGIAAGLTSSRSIEWPLRLNGDLERFSSVSAKKANVRLVGIFTPVTPGVSAYARTLKKKTSALLDLDLIGPV